MCALRGAALINFLAGSPTTQLLADSLWCLCILRETLQRHQRNDGDNGDEQQQQMTMTMMIVHNTRGKACAFFMWTTVMKTQA